MQGKKISILLSSFSSGGTERAMLNLGSALAGKGATVEFLLTKKEGEFLEEASQKFKTNRGEGDGAQEKSPRTW